MLHQRKIIVVVKMIYGSNQFTWESRVSCTILLKARNAFLIESTIHRYGSELDYSKCVEGL